MKKNLLNKLKKRSKIDFLSLFAIFFIAAGAYFFLSRKTEYLDVTLRLFNQDSPEYYLDNNQPKAWYIEHIKVGKAQRGSFGEKIVEIVDVYSYPNGHIYNDVYVTLRLKIAQNKITKQYIYEGSPLLIHEVKSFKIQDLLINGEIIDINNKPKELKKVAVTFELQSRNYDLQNNSQARLVGIENYLAEMIKENLVIKDSKGQELVKINKVNKKPGEVLFATANGLQRIVDPERTRVTIEADVLAEKINDFYFYRKEESLIVDQQIYLTFDNATVIGKITDIKM